MLGLFRKPLFWTNAASLVFVGVIAFSVAHGWTNPSAAPVGGSGEISVDSSGNVGIGTASPSQKLDVNGSIHAMTSICIGSDCRGSWPFSNVQVFNANGSWVVPAGVTKIIAEVWGGGAAGGRSTYSTEGYDTSNSNTPVLSYVGGGAGGYGKQILSVTPGETLSIVVGAGGVAANSFYEDGLIGGSSAIIRIPSTFLISANGGGILHTSTVLAKPQYGGSSTALENIKGQDGSAGYGVSVGGNAPRGGLGGVSYTSTAGGCVRRNATVPGGGGSGYAGGCLWTNGAAGRVIIYY